MRNYVVLYHDVIRGYKIGTLTINELRSNLLMTYAADKVIICL